MIEKPSSIIAEEKIQYLGINFKKKCVQPIWSYDKKFLKPLKDTKIKFEQMGKHHLFLYRIMQHYKDVSAA